MHAKEIVPSSGLWEHGRHGNSGPAQGDVAAKRFTKQAPAKCFDGIQLLGCPGCDWPVSYALLRRHPPVGRQKRASPAHGQPLQPGAARGCIYPPSGKPEPLADVARLPMDPLRHRPEGER